MVEQHPSNLTSFLKWAAQLGISDAPHHSISSSSSCLGHSLTIADFPEAGGRGLAAVRNLRKGELILRAPKSALMTSESVLEKDHNLAHALKGYPSLSSTQVLTVCLLAEVNKGRGSAWYPYVMQLPRSYDIFASFGPFETKALQVDDAIWLAEKVISKAESDWSEAVALLKQLKLKPQLMKLKAWLWAFATISSRTLHVPWDDAGCLCPVGDLFNYAAPGEELASTGVSESWLDDSLLQVRTSQDVDDTANPLLEAASIDAYSGRLIDGGYEEDLASYCLYAKKNYRIGEQVLLSYGTYTNLELLEHYGFLLDGNPNDKVFIPLERDIYACHSWPADSLYIQHDGKPSFALLSALRMWATSPNKRKSVGYLALSGSQLSPENDITVMKWLISNCRAILESLPSTVEDDLSILGAIEEAQQLQSFEEPDNLSSAASMEFCNFFKSLELCCGGTKIVSGLSSNVKKSMDRWALAVQWRLSYRSNTELQLKLSLCEHALAASGKDTTGWAAVSGTHTMTNGTTGHRAEFRDRLLGCDSLIDFRFEV